MFDFYIIIAAASIAFAFLASFRYPLGSNQYVAMMIVSVFLMFLAALSYNLPQQVITTTNTITTNVPVYCVQGSALIPNSTEPCGLTTELSNTVSTQQIRPNPFDSGFAIYAAMLYAIVLILFTIFGLLLNKGQAPAKPRKPD